MKKLLLLLLVCLNVFSQKTKVIKGIVVDVKREKDTILFTTGLLNTYYYENPSLISKIEINKFTLKGQFSYPQMFFTIWNNDRKKGAFEIGELFIDDSAKYIKIDSVLKKSIVESKTHLEFTTKFIPYILGENTETEISDYIFNHQLEFDSKLEKYVRKIQFLCGILVSN